MKTTTSTLYIVRHGESEANVQHIWGGDYPLSDQGKLQALNLAKRLKDIKFDAIYSSDLVRTQQTIAQIALEQEIQVVTLEVLRERHYGDAENKRTEELSAELQDLIARYSEQSEDQYWHGEFPPNGETNEEATTRFITKLREIALAHPGGTVLVASHGNLMRNFLVKLGFATFAELPHGALNNTGWARIESDGVDFFVKETEGIHLVK